MSSEGPKRPAWMPENRQFSQADPRIVQRPEGLTGEGGTTSTKPAGISAGQVERYAPLAASPGGWWEGYFLTTQPLGTVGGQTLLCDAGLGFVAHTVLVDNWTNQWLLIDGVRRFIPPYTGGWVLNAMSGTQQARVELEEPGGGLGGLTQPAPIAGEYVWVGFAEAVLPPSTGMALSGAGTISVTLRDVAVIQPNNSPISALLVSQSSPQGTDITASSDNVANAAAVATLPGAPGKTTYITGFQITASGSTAALDVIITIVGVISGTMSYIFSFPLGALVAGSPVIVTFPRPVPASGQNVSIVVTLPAGGVGNTNAAVSAQGYQL